jgi:DNA-binding NarL/FixJ family response regulator
LIKVFLVDDHHIVREGIKKILVADDISIVGEAESAEEALSAIQSVKPDVVILDIALPGRRGLDVISDFRDRCPQCAIIMLSMYPERQFALRAFRQGADGYVTKDSAPSDLIIAIRRVMKGQKYVSASLATDLADMVGENYEAELHQQLSEREMTVFLLLVQGKSVKQIAEELTLSINTVSTYQTRIFYKLKVNSAIDLVHYAYNHGLIQ